MIDTKWFQDFRKKKVRDLSTMTWCHVSVFALVKRLSAEWFVNGGGVNVNGLFTHFYCQQCCLKRTLSFLTLKTFHQKIDTWAVKKAFISYLWYIKIIYTIYQDSRKWKDHRLFNNSFFMSCFRVGFGESVKCRVACEVRRW